MLSVKKDFYRFVQYLGVIFGVLFSIYMAWFTYNYYHEKQKAQLETASEEIVLLIKNRMLTYEQVLRSGIAFFKSSDEVSREDWKLFTKEHDLNKNFRGIQGFGYSEVVLPKDKQNHEKKIQNEGFSDFKIHPSGKRELYTSIIYLEPFDIRNIRAFGYDMFSEKNRRVAMTKAVETGEPSLSAKITLVQEFSTDIQAGFLMYLPLYKKGYKLNSKADRMAAIQGFVYAPFRANDLMNGVLGKRFPNIDFEIYDGNIINNIANIFSSIFYTFKAVFFWLK